MLRYEGNNTFSYANNVAVDHAESSKLIFCNNDIIFTSNVLDLISSKLDAKDIGCVGVELYYPVRDKHTVKKGGIQHCGISFEYDSNFEFYRPFNIKEENRFSSDLRSPDILTAAY